MLRTKRTASLFAALVVFFAMTQMVHAWSFMNQTYPAPLDGCLVCHTSNNASDPGFAMNPFGAEYVEANHLRLFHGISRHFRDGPDTPDCNASLPKFHTPAWGSQNNVRIMFFF